MTRTGTGPQSRVTLENLGLWLARRLLSVWVKTTVTPANPQTLGIDPQQPVFYLLETRSLANLLVAEQACVEHRMPRPTAPLGAGPVALPRAVAAAINWRGRSAPGRSLRYSDSLAALLRAGVEHPEQDLQLVPVAVFFGRRPDRESSSLKLLLSDSSVYVGRLRKFLIVLLHGRNTWVQFGAPVLLQDFLAQADSAQQDSGAAVQARLRKLCRLFRVHFRQQRTAAIGPDLSQLHSVVERLLRTRSVRRAVNAEAEREGVSEARAVARARRYGYEIAADFSYPFIFFMSRVLRRLWDRLYDGVEVRNIATLQRHAPGHTLVYLPCHRSHIDYLLLSYVLHAHGLAIPHIAAGINLNIPLVGPFLRRGGAFFLRRSFRGKPLYAAVFHAYLSDILAKGFPVEYFVEGGRSRTGLSLPPRPGMLDMTVRAYLTERGPAERRRPLLLVPVYIGYEKLVEGRSYQAELGGAKKQKESLLGLIKGLKALRSAFGKVQLSFGEPIVLGRLLDRHRPGWEDESFTLEQRPEWLPPFIDQLGRQVVSGINAAAAVNPVNLLALALLAAPRYALAEEQLYRQLKVYQQLLCRAPAPYTAAAGSRASVTELGPAEIVAHGERLGVVERREHPLGAIISAADDDPLRLIYFHNNVLHLVALPGLLACCVVNAGTLQRAQLLRMATLVYPLLHSQLFLPWPPGYAAEPVDETLQLLLTLGLVNDTDGRYSAPPAGGALALLARPVLDTVERFFLAVALLLKSGAGVLSDAQFERGCYLLAQRLALLYAAKTPDFVDQTLFRNVLKTLQAQGLIWRDKRAENETLQFGSDFAALFDEVSLMLPAAYREHVLWLTDPSLNGG